MRASIAFIAGLLASGAAVGAARAEAPRRAYDIPAKSLADALIDLGLQARATIGGTPACHGRSRPLVGQYTLTEALDHLLAGSSCRYEMVDARTVRIVRARRWPFLPHPAPVAAATVAPSPRPASGSIDELVVTTNRRATRFGSLPGGLSIIGGDVLTTTGAIDTGDVARQAAGFITTNLGPSRDKIMLRGLSDGAFTGRTQSTVGTYLDDVPLIHNAPDPDLKLADVERVEILRGPQGALYGGGSLSGVYRIVSRKPAFDVVSGEATVAGSVTESGSPSTQVQAVLNAPVVTGVAAARLVAYRDVEGGYIDDVNLRQSDVDRTTRSGGRLALSARLGEGWSITLTGTSQDVSSTDTQYVTQAKGKLQRANQVRETHSNRLAATSVVVVGAGDWGRFESTTAFIDHEYASRYDATAALTAFSDTSIEVGVYDEAVHVRRFVEDAVWSSPEDRRLRWLAGAFLSSGQETGAYDLRARVNNAPPRAIYQEHRGDRLREYAAYGEISYDLGGGWTATVGARVFRTTVGVRSNVVAPSPGRSRVFAGDADFQGVSPKISIQRALGGGLVYALASEGYRAGGFNTAGLTPPSAKLRAFQPDHLRNYEIGAAFNPFDGRLRLRTALFYDVWNGIQTDQYFSSGLSYTANVGDGRNLGLEAEAVWRPNDRFSLQGNALLNTPKLTRADPNFAASSTSALPGVPDVSFGLLAAWRKPLTPRYDLLLTGEANYVGRSRLTFDSRYSPTMGGYVTAKMSAQILAGRWRAALFVWNPFNAAGDTFAYGNPFSFGQVRQVTPQRPRTWTLSVSANF